MFRLEGELTARCASLESKVEELSQALAQEQAALAREKEGQVAAEKAKAERISALLTIMQRERQQWQEQLKRRDDSLKGTQEKLYSISRLLQTKEAAAEALKKTIVTLELQQQENKVLLSNARSEAMADREARIAAEESARKLGSAQQSLEKERLKYKELEQQMQAHVTGLTSLFRKLDTADSRVLRRGVLQ
jgi:chromosome segregation ATPase